VSGVAIAGVARMIAATALAASASACVGHVGETSSEVHERNGGSTRTTSTSTSSSSPSVGDGQTGFACDPAIKPPPDQLRRLTIAQYRNTVASLAAWSLGSAAAAAALMTDLAEPLRALPVDHREAVPQDLHGSYRRLDQSLQQEHVDAFYAVGIAVGQASASAPSWASARPTATRATTPLASMRSSRALAPARCVGRSAATRPRFTRACTGPTAKCLNQRTRT